MSQTDDVVLRPDPCCDLCGEVCPGSENEIIIHFCEKCGQERSHDAVSLRNLAQECDVYEYPASFIETMMKGAEVVNPLLLQGFENLGTKLLPAGIDVETWKRWNKDELIMNAVIQIAVAYALILE